MSILFRVRDTDINRWVVSEGEEMGPTAEHKKDATIFHGETWLNYWQEAKGIEIVPLAETEVTEHYAQTGLNLEPPTRYNIKNGDVWLVSVVESVAYYSARRSEAKNFTEAEIEAWRDKPGLEIVEVLNRFGIKGKVDILKFEGF